MALTWREVEHVLERWIELRDSSGMHPEFGGVSPRPGEESGWKLACATVAAKIWRLCPEVNLGGGEWQPAVYAVALLRYLELPAVANELSQARRLWMLAPRDAEIEMRVLRLRSIRDEVTLSLSALQSRWEYQRGMRRLAGDLGMAEISRLWAPLAGGLDNTAAEPYI